MGPQTTPAAILKNFAIHIKHDQSSLSIPYSSSARTIKEGRWRSEDKKPTKNTEEETNAVQLKVSKAKTFQTYFEDEESRV